jgi:hypothetical protein
MAFRGFIAIVSILLSPVFALAAGTTCAAATPLVPDGRILKLDYLAPVTSGFYSVYLIAGRSYSLEIRDDMDGSNSDLSVALYNSTCSTPISTGVTHTETIEPVEPAGGWRLSYLPTVTGTYALQVQNSNQTSGRYVSASVAETTIYDPLWADGGSNVPSFSVFNTTTSTIAYTLTLTATIGGSQTGSFQSSLTPLNVALVSVPGQINLPANLSGYGILIHNGPPGAIQLECTLWNQTANNQMERNVPCAPIRQQR